jgi:hypothetical protein
MREPTRQSFPGNFLNGLSKLSGKHLFTDIFLSTLPFLFGAAIIVMPLVPLSGDGAATLSAGQKPSERE